MDSIKSRLQYYKLVPASPCAANNFSRLCGPLVRSTWQGLVCPTAGGLQGRRLTERTCTFSTTRVIKRLGICTRERVLDEHRQPSTDSQAENANRLSSSAGRSVRACWWDRSKLQLTPTGDFSLTSTFAGWNRFTRPKQSVNTSELICHDIILFMLYFNFLLNTQLILAAEFYF